MKKFFALIMISAMFLTSCAWFGANMRKVSVGMTRYQVMEAVGNPINVIESKRSDGTLLETWEYPGGGDSRFWLYFENGKVKNWKRTGLY